MIRGVWHTSFTVKDIEKSKKFYTEILGLELIHEQIQHNTYTQTLVGYPDAHLKVAMLAVPKKDNGPSGHVLELVQYVTPEGEFIPPGTCHIRSAHMAFVVDDIFGTVNKMKEQGVRFKSDVVSIEEGRNKGGYTVYFYDIDDITLELVQPPKRGE